MNKLVEDAIAKGKVLRQELDSKAEEEAKQREEQKKTMEAAEKAKLQLDAERYLDRVPEYLTKAVAERKTSFILLSYDSNQDNKLALLTALIKLKLQKMGLQFKYTSSTSYVYTSFDPDQGYDALYYHLEVIVPDESP